ncbi:MAG: amidohydrolase family protein [Paenibacillaceae bacterium]|nr:amidohydrolase family protein [Paenibacillaceae bacterium]
MKLYDANTMIGAYVREQVQIRDEAECIRISTRFGIEKTVAYHADARSLHPAAGNAKLAALCRNEPSIVPCFVVSPHYKYEQGWAFLEQELTAHRVRFVRMFPREHGYTLGSAHVAEMLAIAGRLGLTVMLSYGEIYQEGDIIGENPLFEQLCRQYRDVAFVLTEAPHRRNMMWYSFLEQHPNVYVEMSINDNWLTYERTVALFGSERLLWGSNRPFNSPGPSVTMLAYAELPETDKANIAYKNLERLMER